MSITRKHIVIVGTNFAGYTAALELKEMLGDQHDITVISPTHQFLFYPSLIWFPFGLRDEKDITFDVRPIYQSHGITFIEKAATHFDLNNRLVHLEGHDPVSYDYLVIATGFSVDYDYVPGLREYAHSIIGIAEATKTREAWQRFLQNPGPAVVVSVQGTGCFGAAYEILFNMRYQLAKHIFVKSRRSLTSLPSLILHTLASVGLAMRKRCVSNFSSSTTSIAVSMCRCNPSSQMALC